MKLARVSIGVIYTTHLLLQDRDTNPLIYDDLTPSILHAKPFSPTDMAGWGIIALNAEPHASIGSKYTRPNVACFSIEFMTPIGLQYTKANLSFRRCVVMHTYRGMRFA